MEMIQLEDGRDYIILDTIEIDNINYVYLVLSTNQEEKTGCIRKIVDNGKNLAGLDTEEEYKKAMNAYIEKYKNIFKEVA